VVIPVRRKGRGLDLRRALSELARRGVSEVLVEGGGALGASLLRDRLVDEVHWFMAARFLGVEGRPALGGLGLRRLADAPALTDVRVRRVGPDLYLRGRVEDRSGGSR
jgi:diaminohydroxyphosphoribosylaminopyrimidine deaminase/5-amino-6-(5-phosphoribosylamino)uracil reductase